MWWITEKRQIVSKYSETGTSSISWALNSILYPRILDIQMNLDNGCFESYEKEKPEKKSKIQKHWNDLDD